VAQRLTAATLIPATHELLRAASGRRWNSLWKRRLVPAVLVLSDVLFTLLIWTVASALQGVWGRGELSVATVATMVPVIAVWVGLRALLGLYPGYGLDSVEELRRHTYSCVRHPGRAGGLHLGVPRGEPSLTPAAGPCLLGSLALRSFRAVSRARHAMKRRGCRISQW
jgi:hypothetical protein